MQSSWLFLQSLDYPPIVGATGRRHNRMEASRGVSASPRLVATVGHPCAYKEHREEDMSETRPQEAEGPPQLTALNGMRFFAVFHIFLYHLWSTRFESPSRPPAPFDKVFANMESFPVWLNNLLAHGYLSTSFFFLLSGFILAYLYWKPSGELSTTRERFWWQRFTRVYPAHLIALLLTIL